MRTKKSMINIIISVVSLTITTILSFILSKNFINLLGVDYNGLNGVFNNIISIISITELGIAGTISYCLYKPIYQHDIKKISSLMYFFKKAYSYVGYTIAVLALIISIIVPIFIKDTTFSGDYIRIVFLIFSINSVLSYFFSYNRTLFYANQENYYITGIDFLFKTIKTFLQLYILNIYQNYILFLIVNVFFTFINNFVIYLLAKKKYPEINFKKTLVDSDLKKEVMSTIKSLAVIQIVTVAINSTDNLIISSLIGITSAGLFVNYNLIYTQLNSIVNTIFNSIGASLGNLYAENDSNKIKNVMYNFEYLGFFLGSLFSICLLFLVQPFISTIWLGSKYLLSSYFVIIIVLNLYLLINRQSINYYLRLSGYYKEIVFPLVLEAIINLIVSIYLAIKIGIIGVIIGTIISSLVGYYLTAKRYNYYLKQKNYIYWLRQLLFFAIYFIEVVAIYAIVSLIHVTNPIIYIIILLLICILILMGTILFIITKNKKLYIFRNIINKLLRRKIYE